ncbi:hypothetical protein [Nostoc sp.]
MPAATIGSQPVGRAMPDFPVGKQGNTGEKNPATHSTSKCHLLNRWI